MKLNDAMAMAMAMQQPFRSTGARQESVPPKCNPRLQKHAIFFAQRFMRAVMRISGN